jgi:uncharacterized protein YpuA (DUF1002 family)
MKTLARAVVQALAFLEFADDEKVNSDAAIDLMDSIGETLQQSTEEERETLREVVMAAYNERNAAGAPEEEIDFYEHFMQDFGLDEADEEGEAEMPVEDEENE